MRKSYDDILEQELHQMVRAHVESKLSLEKIELINQAIDAVVDGFDLTKEQQDVMSEFDIKADTKEEFTAYLNGKYEHSLSRFNLKAWVDDKFELSGSVTHHFFKFYAQAGLKNLVDELTSQHKRLINGGEGSSSRQENRNGFFNSSDNGDDREEGTTNLLKKYDPL